jgi:hypothetical protein
VASKVPTHPKQHNKYPQKMLIHAAKMPPRNSAAHAMIANRSTSSHLHH